MQGWWKRLVMVCVVFLSAEFCALNWAHAAFEDTGTGAREAALGGSYVAMGDDVLSLMYNPAGLARVHQKEMTAEYARLYAGLTDQSSLSQSFLGYGQPVKWGGTMAFGWKQFSLDTLYTERTLSLGYGEWITPRVAWGGAVKQLYHSFEAPGIVVDNSGNVQSGTPNFFAQNGTSKSAYSTDLGMLYRMTDRHTIGISIQDINEPNVALSNSDHEIVPRTIRAGLAYDARRHLTLAAAVTSREGLSNQQDYTWTASGEKWWETKDVGAVALRGSLASGSREFRQYGMGASYRLQQFQIDYAFVFNLSGIVLGDTAGTHRFSLSYRFGSMSTEHYRSLARPEEKKAAAHRAQHQPDIEALLMYGEPGSQLSTTPATSTTAVVSPSFAQLLDQVRKAAPPGSTVVVVVPPANAAGASSQETATATSPADFAVPLTAVPARTPVATPAAASARELLLLQVQSMFKDYAQMGTQGLPAETRVTAFDPLFDTMHSYLQESDQEIIELMDASDELDATARYYARIRRQGASTHERLNYITRSLEKFLEPMMMERHWNLLDARDQRYRLWLREAWTFEHKLTARGASAGDRLSCMQRMVSKAIAFERQAPEPLFVEKSPVVKKAPVIKKTIARPRKAPAKPRRLPKGQSAKDRYEQQMRDYARMVEQGASIPQRSEYLRKVLRDCDQAGLECREAYREFETTFKEEMGALGDGEKAWKEYESLMDKGATAEEKADFLKKLLGEDR